MIVRKRIVSIILLLFSIIFVGLFMVLIYDNVNLKGNNTKLNHKVSSLETDIKKLKDNELNNKECTFTKTLKIVDILDYDGAVPDDIFILVDYFQSFNPFVLKISINNEVKEGLYYEFTFKGNKDKYTNNDSSLSKFKILSIKETNKEGLSQIQEECK
jgi:hypothetical protein